MESSHLVIFSTSGKVITKFNVLCCISLSETIFWTRARGRIPITLSCANSLPFHVLFSLRMRIGLLNSTSNYCAKDDRSSIKLKITPFLTRTGKFQNNSDMTGRLA